MLAGDTNVGCINKEIRNRKWLDQINSDQNSLQQKGGFAALQQAGYEPLVFGPGSKGKKRVPEPYYPSLTRQFKPHARKLYPPKGGSGRIQGVRQLEPHMPFNKRVPECRHNIEAMTRSGFDIPQQNSLVWDRKRVVKRDDGSEARNYISTESSLEKDMGMKIRIDSVERKRNGIPCSFPGDKLYSSSEYCPGYFKKEEFIPHQKEVPDIEENLETSHLKKILKDKRREKNLNQQKDKEIISTEHSASFVTTSTQSLSKDNNAVKSSSVQKVKIPYVYKRALADMNKEMAHAYGLTDDYDDIDESDLEEE